MFPKSVGSVGTPVNARTPAAPGKVKFEFDFEKVEKLIRAKHHFYLDKSI
jgi:hypothetical protein